MINIIFFITYIWTQSVNKNCHFGRTLCPQIPGAIERASPLLEELLLGGKVWAAMSRGRAASQEKVTSSIWSSIQVQMTFLSGYWLGANWKHTIFQHWFIHRKLWCECWTHVCILVETPLIFHWKDNHLFLCLICIRDAKVWGVFLFVKWLLPHVLSEQWQDQQVMSGPVFYTRLCWALLGHLMNPEGWLYRCRVRALRWGHPRSGRVKVWVQNCLTSVSGTCCPQVGSLVCLLLSPRRCQNPPLPQATPGHP